MIRSKQYNILIVLMLLVTIFVSGCSQEEDIIPSNGTLCLSIGQTSKVAETRATPAQLGKPLVEKFNLRVQRNDNVCYDGKFVDELELKVGTYEVIAYHGENVTIGKDAPYYEGTAVAEIEKDAATSVLIPCRVANALVSVIFGRNDAENARFEQYYEKYGVIVRVGSHSLAITEEEKNVSVYFPAGSQPTLFFYGVLRENGEVVSCELQSDYLPSPFAAADHAIVTLTLPESELEVNIAKVDVETVSIEETIPFDWLPAPIATAQHRYDASGYLVGTDVAFSNAYPGVHWCAVVTNAAGVEVRRVEGSGELTSLYNSSSSWPYLPSGEYTVTGYLTQGASTIMANSKVFSVGKPELKVAVGGYTSYSKYLEGDINGANACDRSTIYSPSVALSVSEAILSNSNYNYEFAYTYAGSTEVVSMGRNSYSVAAIQGQTVSTTPYRLSANAMFDGVTASAYKDFYITGLPVNYAPPTKNNGWTSSSYVDFNTGNVKLGHNALQQTQYITNMDFAVPQGTKVYMDYDFKITTLTKGTTLTVTLGDMVLFEKSESAKLFSTQNFTHKGTSQTVTLPSTATQLKCNNSYGLGTTYSTIYSLNLKYGK